MSCSEHSVVEIEEATAGSEEWLDAAVVHPIHLRTDGTAASAIGILTSFRMPRVSHQCHGDNVVNSFSAGRSCAHAQPAKRSTAKAVHTRGRWRARSPPMGGLLRLDFMMTIMPCHEHVNCQAQAVHRHYPGMSRHALSSNRHLYQFREQIRLRETTTPMMIRLAQRVPMRRQEVNDPGNCRNSGICSNAGGIIQSGSGWGAKLQSGMGLTD